MPKPELDALDHKILDALQDDGRLTNVELADRIGLSASPCLRRVKRLEADGVIGGYRAILDRRRVGLSLTVFVGLKVDRHADEAATTGMWAAIDAMPEVVSCHIVSGESDYLLEVVVPDLEYYEGFLLGTLLKLPLVRDVRSSFAIRRVKQAGPLPLGHLR